MAKTIYGTFVTEDSLDDSGVGTISDTDVTDLTDSGDSTLHYHATDRNRANHTGTQTASTISDFDTEVANNVTVAGHSTKLDYISVTQAVDLDTMESNIATNNAKVTNAVHTGDAYGGEVLTISDNAVTYAKMQNSAGNNVLLGNDNGAGADLQELSATEVRTILNVENGAEVNNISDVNATDLTDAGDTSLHYHSADRARANHTGTQAASTISDFDTEVSNNTDVVANTTHRSSDGSDHSYINQAVTTTSNPTFNSISVTTTVDGRDVSVDGAKLDYITVTQAVDLDTMESDVAANNAKVTNATHTGDVTGDTVLTIAAGAVDLSMLSATGTKDNTTYLRGDNTWASLTAATTSDAAYDRSSWDGDTTISPSKNAVSDAFYNMVRWLDADTGGTDCTFIGETGNTTNTGARNLFAGVTAGGTNTSATDIVAVGYGACNTGDSYTVGIGTRAAYSGTNSSVFIGYESGEDVVADYNVGVGYRSMNTMSNAGTQYNVAVGYSSMYLGTHVSNTVAIGAYALEDYTAGANANTVAVGYGAGRRATSGAGNVFIGYEAGPTVGSAGIANSLYINNAESDTPLIYGSFANDYVEVRGYIKWNPPTSVTLTGNGEMVIYATSNTNARIAFKGTDGTVRTGDITLS